MEQRQIEQWIKSLIRSGQIHLFYISSQWRRLRVEVLRDQHYECQRCKFKGKYQAATNVHHKETVRKHPDLALTKSNLESLCDSCHYDEHHKKQSRYAGDEKW